MSQHHFAPPICQRLGQFTVWLVCFGPLGTISSLAETTNDAGGPIMPLTSPDAGLSLIRVIGALVLVIGLFLGGVWLFRNWQRLGVQRGRGPKLNILETRSLGGRQAIYVVGYERERFLIASSPAGINLLSHLPTVAEAPEMETKDSPAPSFAQALSQVLKGK